MWYQISYSPEVRQRAIRLVFEQQKEHESQWSARYSRLHRGAHSDCLVALL